MLLWPRSASLVVVWVFDVIHTSLLQMSRKARRINAQERSKTGLSAAVHEAVGIVQEDRVLWLHPGGSVVATPPPAEEEDARDATEMRRAFFLDYIFLQGMLFSRIGCVAILAIVDNHALV